MVSPASKRPRLGPARPDPLTASLSQRTAQDFIMLPLIRRWRAPLGDPPRNCGIEHIEINHTFRGFGNRTLRRAEPELARSPPSSTIVRPGQCPRHRECAGTARRDGSSNGEFRDPPAAVDLDTPCCPNHSLPAERKAYLPEPSLSSPEYP